MVAKIRLQQPPSDREITIFGGQSPNGMYMVWQDHNSIDTKPSLIYHIAERHLQKINSRRVLQYRMPVICDRCKEESASLKIGPALIRHFPFPTVPSELDSLMSRYYNMTIYRIIRSMSYRVECYDWQDRAVFYIK